MSGDTSQFIDQRELSNNSNYNHRANFRFEWKIDSLNSILITPSLNVQKYDNNSEVSGLTYLTGNDTSSQTLDRTSSKRSAYNFNNNILYRHSFRKRGRTFSLNFNTGINNQDADIYTDNYTRYFKGSLGDSDTTLQFDDQVTKGYQLSGSANYTEPVGKKGAILEFRYNPSFSSNEADKQAFFL